MVNQAQEALKTTPFVYETSLKTAWNKASNWGRFKALAGFGLKGSIPAMRIPRYISQLHDSRTGNNLISSKKSNNLMVGSQVIEDVSDMYDFYNMHNQGKELERIGDKESLVDRKYHMRHTAFGLGISFGLFYPGLILEQTAKSHAAKKAAEVMYTGSKGSFGSIFIFAYLVWALAGLGLAIRDLIRIKRYKNTFTHELNNCSVNNPVNTAKLLRSLISPFSTKEEEDKAKVGMFKDDCEKANFKNYKKVNSLLGIDKYIEKTHVKKHKNYLSKRISLKGQFFLKANHEKLKKILDRLEDPTQLTREEDLKQIHEFLGKISTEIKANETILKTQALAIFSMASLAIALMILCPYIWVGALVMLFAQLLIVYATADHKIDAFIYGQEMRNYNLRTGTGAL